MFGSQRPAKGNIITLAEFGSLQLELVRLSQLTGNLKYERAGNHILEKISRVPSRVPGLYPMIWDLETFTPRSSKTVFKKSKKLMILYESLYYYIRWCR